ncbi:MAG TPA: tetratricopeptide repeat protein, partial [Polyangiales bacterium]|nr:tetratricopeptide repeat protein [Polyangiales bacterium]
DDTRREELYVRAREIAERAGDPALVEAILRELLSLDDGNRYALQALTKLRENAGDFGETFQLLVKQSELASDPVAARELRLAAAAVARDKLSDAPRAVQLYEQLFEEEPTERVAPAALRELYVKLNRHQDLARMIERLIDVATSPIERSVLRLELAQLFEEQFQAFDNAIDQLRAILDEEPGQPAAVVRLSALYERTGRDEELADLLASQIEAAGARGDVAAELSFQVRLGEISESRLNDRERAIQTYRGVLRRESKHRGALEALARLLRAENRLDEASEVLSSLLDQASGEEAVQLSLALSDVHGALGADESSVRALERGIAVSERSESLNQRLAAAYARLERHRDLAQLLARQAEFAESPRAAVQLLRQAATTLATRAKDDAGAAELLSRAAELAPDDRELLLELCDRYSASGRGQAAAQVLEKIVAS